jgi:F-type H+-transporting ATPase subunit alpha
MLLMNGGAEFTSLLYAGITQSMALQFISPMSGTCLAEYSRNSGWTSLVSYDDLTKHAIAYRQLSLFYASQLEERPIPVMFLPA